MKKLGVRVQKAGEEGFCDSSKVTRQQRCQTVNAVTSKVSTSVLLCGEEEMNGNDTKSTDPHTLLGLACFYNKHAANEKINKVMTKIRRVLYSINCS